MDSSLLDTDNITHIVGRFLNIEDITQGDEKRKYLVRYRGRLRVDSAQAYDQMAKLLRPLNITPLFRVDGDQHAVILVSGVVLNKPSRIWINGVLMALTILSVILAGIIYTLGSVLDGALPASLAEWLPYISRSLGGGIAFAVGLLSILLAHEFGHYLAGRFHNSNVTLPYFIPFPFSVFGTMGAFIQLKEPPKNRRVLMDIGIAGPLAGLVVAIPVLIIGLSLSQVSRLPMAVPGAQGFQMEGNSILYLLSKYLVFGRLLPEPSNYAGLSPLLYWVRYFFTGQPFPYGGEDVLLHPLAWAGWAGLLVTALNLIPAGQLDGGHLLYVLFGKRASLVLPFILAALVGLGLFWPGWWLWAFLILILGRAHAEPLDQITTLNTPRIAVALLGLVVFVLVFTPVPLLSVGF